MLREDIIAGAFHITGKYSVEDAISTADSDYAVKVLDGLLATLGSEAEFWTKTTESVFRVYANVPTVNLAAITGYDGSPRARFLYASGTLTSQGTTTGAANTYAVTLTGVTVSAGTKVTLTFNATNTGASTLNVNAGGAVAIRKNGNVALAAGDIQANDILELAYDGTNWQLYEQASNVTDFSLRIINAAEWAALLNKDTFVSVPDLLYIDSLNMGHFYGIPSVNGILKVQHLSKVSASAAAAAPDLPTEWGLALQYGLAVYLAHRYGMPSPKLAEVATLWNDLKTKLFGANVDSSQPVVTSDEED